MIDTTEAVSEDEIEDYSPCKITNESIHDRQDHSQNLNNFNLSTMSQPLTQDMNYSNAQYDVNSKNSNNLISPLKLYKMKSSQLINKDVMKQNPLAKSGAILDKKITNKNKIFNDYNSIMNQIGKISQGYDGKSTNVALKSAINTKLGSENSLSKSQFFESQREHFKTEEIQKENTLKNQQYDEPLDQQTKNPSKKKNVEKVTFEGVGYNDEIIEEKAVREIKFDFKQFKFSEIKHIKILYQICKDREREKKPNECSFILTFLEQVPQIKPYLDRLPLASKHKLAQEFYAEKIMSSQPIYTKGEHPKNVSFVVKGTVGIVASNSKFVDEETKKNLSQMKPSYMKKIKQGSLFGELEALYNVTRQSTSVAINQCFQLRIKSDVFRSYFETYKDQFYQKIEFFKECHLFRNWNDASIVIFLSFVKKMKYNNGFKIYDVKDLDKNIYVIESGNICLSSRLENDSKALEKKNDFVKDMKEMNNKTDADTIKRNLAEDGNFISDNKMKPRGKESNKFYYKDIAILEQYASFGDEEGFKGDNKYLKILKASVTSSSANVYVFTKKDYIQNIKSTYLLNDIMKENYKKMDRRLNMIDEFIDCKEKLQQYLWKQDLYQKKLEREQRGKNEYENLSGNESEEDDTYNTLNKKQKNMFHLNKMYTGKKNCINGCYKVIKIAGWKPLTAEEDFELFNIKEDFQKEIKKKEGQLSIPNSNEKSKIDSIRNDYLKTSVNKSMSSKISLKFDAIDVKLKAIQKYKEAKSLKNFESMHNRQFSSQSQINCLNPEKSCNKSYIDNSDFMIVQDRVRFLKLKQSSAKTSAIGSRRSNIDKMSQKAAYAKKESVDIVPARLPIPLNTGLKSFGINNSVSEGINQKSKSDFNDNKNANNQYESNLFNFTTCNDIDAKKKNLEVSLREGATVNENLFEAIDKNDDTQEKVKVTYHEGFESTDRIISPNTKKMLYETPVELKKIIQEIKQQKLHSEPLSQDIIDELNDNVGPYIDNSNYNTSVENSYYFNSIWEDRPRLTKLDLLLEQKEQAAKTRINNSMSLDKKTEAHLLNKLEFNHFPENISMPQIFNRHSFSRNLTDTKQLIDYSFYRKEKKSLNLPGYLLGKSQDKNKLLDTKFNVNRTVSVATQNPININTHTRVPSTDINNIFKDPNTFKDTKGAKDVVKSNFTMKRQDSQMKRKLTLSRSAQNVLDSSALKNNRSNDQSIEKDGSPLNSDSKRDGNKETNKNKGYLMMKNIITDLFIEKDKDNIYSRQKEPETVVPMIIPTRKLYVD